MAAGSASLRVGLAGCGGVARQFHLRTLLTDPRVALLAVADPSPDARAAVGTIGAHLLDDAGELAARTDLDAVVVCSPNATHAELAGAVAGAGKALYLEKPVAIDEAGAQASRLALRAHPVLNAVGFNYRFNPVFAELRRRILTGEIGRVTGARCWHCEVGRPESMSGWRRRRESGGGVSLDLLSHSVDMARWLLDDEVAAVEAATISSRVTEHDDAQVSLRMCDGVKVELRSSYVEGRKHRWEIEGTEGVLRADRWPRRLTRRRSPSASGPSRLSTRLRGIPIPRREPSFALSLSAFLDAALGVEAPRPATVEDGVRSLEVVLAAERIAAVR
jgi:predicted dehydrogenase